MCNFLNMYYYPATILHTTTHIHTAACPSFNINYPPMRTLLCPGDTITYTCAFATSNVGFISTQWSGSGFQCPSNSPANHITLFQTSTGSLNTAPVSCGNLSAVMTNVSGTCYTSVLTISTPQYYNGTTILCVDTSLTTVGNVTLNVQLACKLIVLSVLNITRALLNCLLSNGRAWKGKCFFPWYHWTLFPTFLHHHCLEILYFFVSLIWKYMYCIYSITTCTVPLACNSADCFFEACFWIVMSVLSLFSSL